MGLKTIMLTGDNQRTAEAIGRELELSETIAEVLPQDKERQVASLQQAGAKVAMVGDGINDAPALARAQVGIAVGAGTDVAIESADIVLMKSDLLDAVSAIQLSRAVVRNIKENLFWAFFYNAIGIPLAAGVFYSLLGWKLNPMFGAAAMSLSSVCVVSNALRLRGFRPRFQFGTPSCPSGACPIANEVLPQQANGSDISHVSPQQQIEKENDRMKKTIAIEGMMCAHCVAHVDKALRNVDGVSEVTVSLEDKNAVVTLSGSVTDDQLRAAVTEAGYEVTGIA